MAALSRAHELYRGVIEPCRRALLEPLGSADPLHDVGNELLQLMQHDPPAVASVAHAMLHAHPFSDVPLRWRRCFEEAQLWTVAKTDVATADAAPAYQMPNEEEVELALCLMIHRLDMALILTGAPRRQALIHSLLDAARSAAANRDGLAKPPSTHDGSHDIRPAFDPECCFMRDSRRGLTPEEADSRLMFSGAFTKGGHDGPTVQKPVPRLEKPSLLDFQAHWHRSEAPAVLTDTLSHWPARSCWVDPEYWMRVTIGGRRLVPVELGRSYTDEDWGQTLMTFRQFMVQHLLGQGADPNSHPRGYLAQHDLLAQIPDLRKDIAIPDFCYADQPADSGDDDGTETAEAASSVSQSCSARGGSEELASRSGREAIRGVPCGSLAGTAGQQANAAPEPQTVGEEALAASEDSESSLPSINIWLGPAGTVSPAHTDPHHNILAQIVGRKYVRLFAPSEGAKLYPMGGGKGDFACNSSTGPSEGRTGHSGEADATVRADRPAKRRAECLDASPDEDRARDSQRMKCMPGDYGDATLARRPAHGTGDPDSGSGNANEPGSVNMSNTSRVDVGLAVEWPGTAAPDLGGEGRRARQRRRAAQAVRFPRFQDAEFRDTILQPGDCLFIPRGWWHYVTSLDVSCSVSFWWD